MGTGKILQKKLFYPEQEGCFYLIDTLICITNYIFSYSYWQLENLQMDL